MVPASSCERAISRRRRRNRHELDIEQWLPAADSPPAPSKEDTPLARAWAAFRAKRDQECANLCKPHLSDTQRGAGFWRSRGLLRQRRELHREAIEAFRALWRSPGSALDTPCAVHVRR